MTKFVTIMTSTFPTPTLLWEEQDGAPPKLVGRYASFDDVPDGRYLEVHRFEVPTTAETGRLVNGVNSGRHPVFDADGAPLWEGAKISFRLPTHYINTDQGTGVFRKVNEYGGTEFVADKPRNVHDRNGAIVAQRREQYAATNTYHHSGDLGGARTLSGRLGDPHEHGTTETYIRLADDPRSVCKLVREPEERPASGPSNF